MNADILRLILFIAGVGLILGIYFWDRHKRVNARVHAIKRAQFEAESELGELDDPDSIDSSSAKSPVTRRAEPGSPAGDAGSFDEVLDELDQMVWSDNHAESEDFAQQSSFSFTADEPAQHDDLVDSDIPVMILQLNVVAQDQPFAGNAILRATKELQLEYGDMQIFHRYTDVGKKGAVVFSMASMVEPGVFPLKEMSSFSTPGITLFCQLPGPSEGLAVFSDMLFTAERLAALLQGELQDETHSVLSKQTIEHMRERVLEHGRQVQLVRSRKKRH